MPQLVIKNNLNEEILSVPMPKHWPQSPDVIKVTVPRPPGTLYFVRRGIQDAIHVYWPARVQELAPADVPDAPALRQIQVGSILELEAM